MDPLCLRLILTCIFFFLRHSFNSWIRLRTWRWYELNEILRIASKAMNNYIPHNYLLQTYVTWIFKTNNRSNCSYLRILGNKSNFSKCQTSERNRNRCFEQDQSETPSESLSKKGSQLIVRPLALYQPAFCKRRSSCITDERNIGADFDRNVYPWSLLSIRAQQLVNRLSLSASRHRRRESPSPLPEELFARLVSIELQLPLEERSASLEYVAKYDISARPMLRVSFGQTKLEKARDTSWGGGGFQGGVNGSSWWGGAREGVGLNVYCVTFRRLERRIYREDVLCKRNDGWMGSNRWMDLCEGWICDLMRWGVMLILKDEAREIEDGWLFVS